MQTTYFFYTDHANQKIGPVTKHQLKELAAQGIIGPKTPLETDTGYKGYAQEIIGLKFFSLSQVLPLSDSDEEVDEEKTDMPRFLDIDFTRFITNSWISFIWVITIIAHIVGFFALLFVISRIQGNGTLQIVLFLIGMPLLLLSLLFERISLEIIIVFFRIESNTRSMMEALQEMAEEKKS